MPKEEWRKIAPISDTSKLHFTSGQEYERAAIINYLRQLKAKQSPDRTSFLEAIVGDLLAARHHENCD